MMSVVQAAAAAAWCVVAATGVWAAGAVGAAWAQPTAAPVAIASHGAPVQRVVSLLPALTEMVCALQACDRLVGVDRYSNWPATALADVPVVGEALAPNIERIVALRPDVVLMSRDLRTAQRLQALGMRVEMLEPTTFAQVQRDMVHVARILGLTEPQAQAVWQRVQAGVQAAAAQVPAAVRGQRVYFEVNRGPYAAGSTSFLGELMAALHMGNVVPPELGMFPRLNPEFVLRTQPDVILLGQHSAQAAPQTPGWQRLRAVQQGKVCTFDSAQTDALVRPGPRMDEAAQVLVQCLQKVAGQP